MSAANRIIKNTGFLYLKMGFTVFVSLFTTRLVLSSLGESDFGIFNIVGGAIGMLGFLNSTLANATQRFMSYAEGGGNLENKRKIFNVSISLHGIIAILTACLLLLAMYPLFNNILNIEQDRIFSAKIIYLCLIFSTILTVINVPYDAVMNAHENMLYYSIVGVFESILKLTVAIVCVFSSGDKLIVYGVLMAIIPFVTLSIMKIYCHKKYEECVFSPKKYWDMSIVKEIASFSGWNFLTAISSLFSVQGIGLVLNHFFGTTLNAAQGIAHQLNGQLSSFSLTMLKALNPVIVKKAGENNISAMNEATVVGCKYSVLLIMLFAVPFLIEINYILSIWLKKVPEWTSVFCIMQLILTIVTQMTRPVATAVYAQGDIKGYAIWKSIMNITPIFITYICFIMGGSPIWLYIPMILVLAIGGDIVILYYAKRKCFFSIRRFLMNSLFPICIIMCFMLFLGFIPKFFLPESFIRVILTGFLTTIGVLYASWYFAMGNEEKQTVKNIYCKIARK